MYEQRVQSTTTAPSPAPASDAAQRTSPLAATTVRLNHLSLVVWDVEDAIRLFETYFGFVCVERKGGNAIAILEGRDSFSLVLTGNRRGDAAPAYPGDFHLGFMLDSCDAVTELHRQLLRAGILSGGPPRRMRDVFSFYFLFDNVLIEVGHTLA